MSKLKKMIMMANQTDDKPSLPKEYMQLEYLESTGTQYIDLGYPLGYNNKVVVDVEPINSTVSMAIIGNTVDSNSAILLDVKNAVVNQRFSKNKAVNIYREERYSVSIDNKGVSVKDNLYPWTSSPSDFTTDGNVFIFATRATRTNVKAYYYKGKIYSCQIYDSNVLIHDYVPAFNMNVNRAGLYDLVTGQFFTNQGTGEFTYGYVDDVKNNN